jgi:hypothetical protein
MKTRADHDCAGDDPGGTPEGAGAFSYILLLLIFISPSFVPTDSMSPWLRGFAENQPMTPIIETMRSLVTEGTPRPRDVGRRLMGLGYPGRLLHARSGHLSPLGACPGNSVGLLITVPRSRRDRRSGDEEV